MLDGFRDGGGGGEWWKGGPRFQWWGSLEGVSHRGGGVPHSGGGGEWCRDFHTVMGVENGEAVCQSCIFIALFPSPRAKEINIRKLAGAIRIIIIIK